MSRAARGGMSAAAFMASFSSHGDGPRSAPRRETASTALAHRAETVDALLVSVRTKVEKLITENAETTDWGHAGSLGRVAELLREADEFLGGSR